MKLSTEEAELFFELTWALQFFVNRKKEVIPGIHSVQDFKKLPEERRFQVREALYESPELIDAYVAENPDEFDNEKLDIIKQWKDFIDDDFYIERYLKNYAIFIGANGKVYAVLALHKDFDAMFPRNYLPMYVKAVLLPFKGRVIYDSFLQSYNVHFGGGMKRSLKETYMRAKQNEKIIHTLGEDHKTDNKTVKSPVRAKDCSKELEQLRIIAKKLKGGAGQPVINSSVYSLVKASIELAEHTLFDPSDICALLKEVRKVERATAKIENILHRSE
jgi:hypothetical protein